MGFRRSKEKSINKMKWVKFFNENKDLMYDTGLPLIYLESKELFDDFLMHGFIDHHDVDVEFTTDDMNDEQYKSFKILVWKYFEAGYKNPGLMVFDYEYTQKLKERYPKLFTYR